jgi:DNA-binding transcriptional LysR family regulator
MATVVHLATEGIGIAVIPHELVEAELRDGRLERIQTEVTMPTLSFCASWLESPDTLAVELVVEIAARMAGRWNVAEERSVTDQDPATTG